MADGYGVRRPEGARWEHLPERRTLLIDPTGIVRATYDVIEVDAHAGEVLEDLRALIGPKS